VLILTRRPGETLVLGPSIRVTVVGIRGHQVRIGVDAPTSVRVHREELYNRLQRDERMRTAYIAPSAAESVTVRKPRADGWRESRRGGR
jgi:carbon storage regulator